MIRHGIDLVHLPRLREVMQRHAAFEVRVFTDGERAYCNRQADPLPHFAARFAAKEATLKALGLGLASGGIDARLLQIEVERTDGPPRLVLHGKPAQRADQLGVSSFAISLTHDGDGAIASVILSGD